MPTQLEINAYFHFLSKEYPFTELSSAG